MISGRTDRYTHTHTHTDRWLCNSQLTNRIPRIGRRGVGQDHVGAIIADCVTTSQWRFPYYYHEARSCGVGSGVAPGARAPPCWIGLESFISGRLVSQEESSVRNRKGMAR